MDLLDGDSDLSDYSDAPPPTPGPVDSPTGSPVRPVKQAKAASSSRRSSLRSTKSGSDLPKPASAIAPTDVTETSKKQPRAPNKPSRSSRRFRDSSQIASDDLSLASSGPDNDKATAAQTSSRKNKHKAQPSSSRASSPQAAKSVRPNKKTRQSSNRQEDRNRSTEDVKPEVKREEPKKESDDDEIGKMIPKATSKSLAKRSRNEQIDEPTTSRGATAAALSTSEDHGVHEDDEDDKVKAPLRKRKKVMADDAFSGDEHSADEEMQGSDTEDAYRSDSDKDVTSRPPKVSKKLDKKTGAAVAKNKQRPDAPFKPSAGTAKDKPSTNKVVSAEAKMRASIDAAKDKTLKSASGPAVPKPNPSTSSFRPGAKMPSTGASTPVIAAKSVSAGSGSAGKKGPQASFGKSMSGWDQLFGSISGLSSSPAAPPAKPASKKSTQPPPPNVSAPASAAGIRPDPVLERASLAEIAQMRAQQNESYLNTNQCFDLLAHAEIMFAFEQDAIFKDRKTASLFRGSRFGAGNIRPTQNSSS